MASRRFLLALFLLALLPGLTGCYCVQDVWCGTKQAAYEQVDHIASPCCPDPCGNVYSTPVYGSGCALDPRVGRGGEGAFKTP